jgi:hypothetical protein
MGYVRTNRPVDCWHWWAKEAVCQIWQSTSEKSVLLQWAVTNYGVLCTKSRKQTSLLQLELLRLEHERYSATVKI